MRSGMWARRISVTRRHIVFLFGGVPVAHDKRPLNGLLLALRVFLAALFKPRREH